MDNESQFFQTDISLNRVFSRNSAVNARYLCELQVDTIRYLSVGDILISSDGYVNVQITSLTTPNKVTALWLKGTKEYPANNPFINLGITNTAGAQYVYNTALYDMNKISWTIVKPIPEDKGKGGGGGGGGSSVKRPL